MSLIIADAADLPVPDTVFCLDDDQSLLRQAVNTWGGVGIARVDYATRPLQKVVGGVSVSGEAMMELAQWLSKNHYRLLAHPYVDRFANVYSVGLLFSLGESTIRAEVVGRGFDASDLRLGKADPHEVLLLDAVTRTVRPISQIEDALYAKARTVRAIRAARLRLYEEFAERERKLLPGLSSFEPTTEQICAAEAKIPVEYVPLPPALAEQLGEYGARVLQDVLPHLPASTVYVASLSYFESDAWLLWDVYGQWYDR